MFVQFTVSVYFWQFFVMFVCFCGGKLPFQHVFGLLFFWYHMFKIFCFHLYVYGILCIYDVPFCLWIFLYVH